MVRSIAKGLDPEEFSLVGTSRDLEAIVDKRFEWQVKAYRWYAVVLSDDHIYAVTDIKGKRIA